MPHRPPLEAALGLAAEPPALSARRDAVLRALERAAAASHGSIAQAVRAMHAFVASTAPGADATVDGEALRAAFLALLRPTSGLPTGPALPSAVREANDFITAHLASLRERAAHAGIACPAGAARVQEAKLPVSSGDGMAPQSHRDLGLLGSADAPIRAGAGIEGPAPRSVPEALRHWVNPAIGRIGGR